jgi:hypothetical protein
MKIKKEEDTWNKVLKKNKLKFRMIVYNLDFGEVKVSIKYSQN